MTSILYQSQRAITLLGGGPSRISQLKMALERAPDLVAADGGADAARTLGQADAVQAIIGDLDSLISAETWRKSGVSVHPILEQNTTDFEKCLYSTDAPAYVGVGFLDGRADHALAVFNAMVRWPQKKIVLLGQDEICFLCPNELTLDLPAGSRVSLFPLAEVQGVLSEGLRWSVDGMTLAPDGRIGTSNEACGGPVRLMFDRRGVLVFLEADQLDAALRSLLRVSAK